MDRFVTNIKNGTQAARQALLDQRQAFAKELQDIQSDDTIVDL